MNGTVVCQSILETVRRLVHNSLFLNAYSVGNAFTRMRKLTFLKVFFYLLNSSKKSMPVNMADFMEDFSCVGFPAVSKQALSKARRGISPEAFAELNRLFAQKFYRECGTVRTWNNYLVMAVDGTTLQLPQTERNMQTFGFAVNKKCMPCAMASASMLFDVMNDVIVDAQIGSYNYGENRFALRHLDELECVGLEKDVLLLMDRGYPSGETFRELMDRGMSFVIRLNNSYTSFTCHDEEDFIVDYMPRGYGQPLRLRGIRIPLPDGTMETLATNVYGPEITAEMFRTLYFLRWGIESKYHEFKERIQVEEFSGSHPTAIRQDFHISVFLSNLAALLKPDADGAISKGQECHKESKYKYQANRSFLISRVKKYLVKILVGFLDAAETLGRIVASAQRARSQKQPGRAYSRKGNQSRRKHHNNRKPCL